MLTAHIQSLFWWFINISWRLFNRAQDFYQHTYNWQWIKKITKKFLSTILIKTFDAIMYRALSKTAIVAHPTGTHDIISLLSLNINKFVLLAIFFLFYAIYVICVCMVIPLQILVKYKKSVGRRKEEEWRERVGKKNYFSIIKEY